MIQDVVVEVHRALEQEGIAHAFGGALALMQYAEPRGTVDIDVNVATAVTDSQVLIDLLLSFGFRAARSVEESPPVAGTRFHREGEVVTLDVFFAFHPYHAEVIARAVARPFASSSDVVMLPFLSADDLVVMKLSSTDLRIGSMSSPSSPRAHQ